LVKTISLGFYAGFYGIPPALVWHFAGRNAESLERWPPDLDWATFYVALVAVIGAVHLPIWAMRRWHARRHPGPVRLLAHRVVDIAQELGYRPVCGPRARLFARVPGNQLWQLNVDEFAVHLPGLPQTCEGLTLCHWSDLHFSGRIAPEYFQEVVRQTNRLDVDLIVLTGDVCDRAHTIDWIPETLGPVQARLGKFFVLGNHDLRTHDVQRLRATLGEAGFVDVSGRHETIAPGHIEVAGNERPWFARRPPEREASQLAPGVLRILLSHTPDELAWARRQRFDLMLAGHTHGGQVRFPLVGPVVCPSRNGVRYAAGFFHQPPTLLHVSRGTGSLFPLRLGCPPEITKLVLTKSPTS
jgi:hypothetical protein